MSASSDFYLASAEKARREAEVSTLANVRERCLRSAAAWQEMAEKAIRVEVERDARLAATAASAAAANAAANAVAAPNTPNLPDNDTGEAVSHG
jgi:undecaprenyl pyrophosphate synthase